MNKNTSRILHARNVINWFPHYAFPAIRKMLLVKLVAVTVLILMVAAQTGQAGSATWELNPGSSDWNTDTNWTPATVPNGSADTATFDTSSQTAISLSASTEVDSIIFNPGASAYTITLSPTFSLTLSGAGITNDSGVAQNFVADVDASGNTSTVFFSGNATAGSSTIFTTHGDMDSGNFDPGSSISFLDSSTANTGIFINHGSSSGDANGFGGTFFYDNSNAANGAFTNKRGTFSDASGGTTQFHGTSTAGNGTFTNEAATVSGAYGGYMVFTETSSAGNGTFNNNGGAVDGEPGGSVQFSFGTPTAGNATFINDGGTVSGAYGGYTYFYDYAPTAGLPTAGSGTFINNGGAVSGAHGGTTGFFHNSTAGNGMLIANGGLGAGGQIYFAEDSAGGTSRVEVFGNGFLDISAHDAPGLTIGSLEGDGNVFLGTNQLTVGSNNESSTFSGVIQDGGPSAPRPARRPKISGAVTGGSLVKIGDGSLKLSGNNTYTGGTTVLDGRLLTDESSGTGTINGPLTFESGSVLLAGSPKMASGTLTPTSDLTLNAGAVIQITLGAGGAHSTLNRADGTWTFAPNQAFTILDVGAEPGLYDDIITGLEGDPGGVGSWTITNGGYTGTFSYDGGNIDLTLSAVSATPPQLIAAFSRQVHGSFGAIDMGLPLTGEPAIECRSGGDDSDYTLVFSFNNNVVSGNASVTGGTGDLLGTPTFAGTTMTVNLTNVGNAQKLTVTLDNVTDNLAQVLPDTEVSMNVLVGDTTADKFVDSADISHTKSQSGAPLDTFNYREDLTTDGSIDSADISLVKSRSGTAIAETRPNLEAPRNRQARRGNRAQ